MAKTRIKMVHHLNDAYAKGAEHEVTEEYAKVLVNQGFAEIVKPKKTQPAKKEPAAKKEPPAAVATPEGGN